MFDLRFRVTNDRLFECQYVPIKFFWLDCGDNSMSTPSGDTLFVDSKIFDFEGNLLWDELDDVHYHELDRPAHVGTTDECAVGDKVAPIRCIEFWHGGVDIVCADSIDDRGDINLNGLANEISDAVVFVNYFVYGLSAFTINEEGQIAATDVNADGIVLSVADLVYLIRTIIGDALPYNKLTPYAQTATFTSNGQYLNSDLDLGAALFVFEGQTDVALAEDAGQMLLQTAYDGTVTRALVYSLDRNQPCRGRILETDGALKSVEAVDYYGSAYLTDVLANDFEVANYPNPFNPTTVIELNLPYATDWNVSIYNIVGRKVSEFSGHNSGRITMTWDAADLATGIYFMKVQADSYRTTRKMVLMK